MARIIYVAMLLLLALAACTSTTNNDPPEGNDPPVVLPYSINVNLTDSLSQPLQGYALAFSPVNPPLPWNSEGKSVYRARTTISLSCSTACLVKLEVQDYFGNHVASIFNQSLQAGRHSLSWDGTNNDGERLPDGLYKFWVEYSNNDEVFYCDSTYGYMLAGLEHYTLQNAFYRTDSFGKCSLDDKLSFPHLYCHDDIVIKDGNNTECGVMSFCDSFYVHLWPTDADGNVLERQMRQTKVVVRDTCNTYNLVWSELEPVDYWGDRNDNNNVHTDFRDPDSIYRNYIRIYPNPFN